MQKQEINYSNLVKRLAQQRRIVGLLQFTYRDESNISKWYSLTENLVIKAFGLKSNQLSQLRALHQSMSYHSEFNLHAIDRIGSKEAKEKFKNLLTVFIDELQMDIAPELSRAKRVSTKNILVATQTQTVNTNISIKQVIENIRETEPDTAKVKEAEIKLKELEEELKQKNPAWAKIKVVLEWLLNFSRDAFIAVLPIILEHYKK